MSDERTDKILDYFNTRFDEFGISPKALDYGSEEVMEKRFSQLIGIGPLKDSRILDIGCGLGHLYGYIKKQNTPVNYTGYDINERFLESCREQFPDARFEYFDLIEEEPKEEFDYVFSSGIFNFGFDGDLDVIFGIIDKFYKASNIGCAHNFISTLGDFKNPDVNYFDPKELIERIKPITRRFVLKHDYLPHDFTIYMYK